METQQLQRPLSLPETAASSSVSNRVDFDLEPEDLLAFINYHYVTSPTVRRQRFLLAALGFGILAALPVMVLLGSQRPPIEMIKTSWPLVLAPFGFLVCFPLFYRWGLKRTGRRLLSTGDKQGYYGPRNLSLEDYGVRETTVRGDTIRAWPSVRRIITVNDYALLYTSATEAFVVPKRAFEDALDFDAFVTRAAHRARVRPETH